MNNRAITKPSENERKDQKKQEELHQIHRGIWVGCSAIVGEVDIAVSAEADRTACLLAAAQEAG